MARKIFAPLKSLCSFLFASRTTMRTAPSTCPSLSTSAVPRSPRSRSSTPSPKASARGSSREMSGNPAPRSHLETARSDTCRAAASSFWVIFCSFRAAAISAPVFVRSTLHHLGPVYQIRPAPTTNAAWNRPDSAEAPCLSAGSFHLTAALRPGVPAALGSPASCRPSDTCCGGAPGNSSCETRRPPQPAPEGLPAPGPSPPETGAAA